MKKNFRILALAMSLAFVGPSVAMAADSNLDAKIAKIDKKIEKLEEEYKVLDSTHKEVKKASEAYVDKNGNYVTNKEAAEKKLYKISINLDQYVGNAVPSIEAPMLGVYFLNGAKIEGFTIRPQNATDLYNYLKGYFVLKDGLSKSHYDALLRDYVNAISDNALVKDIEGVSDSIYEDVKAKKDELDKAKLERKSLLEQKDKKVIENLEKAVDRAKRTIDACKNLIKISPKKIAGVRDEIDTIIAQQEKLIKQAEKLISKYK